MKIREYRTAGFTLIELLVVIAIIGILAAVVFVALDPATRFADARDSVRENDVQELLSSIKLYQVDNDGSYPFSGVSDDTPYQISGDSTAPTSGCDTDTASFTCAAASAPAGGDCVSLSTLSGNNYLDEVPVSPDGNGSWSSTYTGYVLEKSGDIITISACDPENASSISASR